MAEGNSESIAAGELVAGRFRVEETLGLGGMAEVYSATDLAGNRRVALKLLKPEIADNAEAVERLRREGEVLRSLQHPAIVSLETFGQLEDGRLFIAMELLDGETLGARMRREGRLEPSALAPIVAGACAGLAAAHDRGIIHRDLKPDNIFLSPAADGLQVKLLDFGISKVTGSDKLTHTGEVLGTPRYMAPEQLTAERDIDGRTDVYALGVIIYEALAGSPPFLAATPSDLIIAILNGKSAPLSSFRPDLDPGFEAVTNRCLARAREARYGSARELAEAFVSLALASEELPAAAADADAAREGMATVALGSMEEGSSRPSPEPSEPRPGTFSELAAARPVVEPWSEPAPPPGSIDRNVGTAETEGHLPPVAIKVDASADPLAQTDPEAAATRAARPARAPENGRVVLAPPTGEYSLPTTNRTLLIVVGVIAGGVSAALCILALRYLLADDEPEVEPPTESEPVIEAPPPVGEAAPAVEAEPMAAAEATAPAAPTPEDPPAAPAEPAPGEVQPAATRRARTPIHRPRSPTASASMETEAPPAPTAPVTAASLLADARRALAGGDPERCVQLVDEAIDRGAPTLALKQRGDCLHRAGNTAGALRAYERFCLLAPDHPAISEVRARVEGLGGSCR